MSFKNKNKLWLNSGFTIVELLVVIVVIGILTSIVLVSFSGINQRAIVASIQSDLKNSAIQMKMYQVSNSDSFPNSIDCSASPAANSICLKSSGSNTYSDFQITNNGGASKFCITLSNGQYNYYITDSAPPQPGTCPVDSSKYVAAGASDACAINASHTLYCWGENSYGEVGDGTSGGSAAKHVPTLVNTTTSSLAGRTVTNVSTGGYNHTCALDSIGAVHCWGQNGLGELGVNSTVDKHIPTLVDTTEGVSSLYGKKVVAISSPMSGRRSCAVDSDGGAHCWGQAYVGDNSTSSRSVPYKVSDANGISSIFGKKITAVATGSSHTCVLDSEGHVHCWGAGNSYGQIGDGTASPRTAPVLVDIDEPSSLHGKIVTAITAGHYHMCVLDSEGKVHCWGRNNYGQLGDGNISNGSSIPVAVDTTSGSSLYGKTLVAVSAGYYHTCALDSEGHVHCWGESPLGNVNSPSASSIPVAVNTTNGVSKLYNKKVRAISSGGSNTVMDTNFNVYGWGGNLFGQLGDGTSGYTRYVPVDTLMP